VRILLFCVALSACAPTVEHPEVPRAAHPAAVIASGQKALAEAGLDELTFGVTPYIAPEQLEAQWTPVLEAVGQRLGVPVRLVMGDSYEDIEKSAVAGELDVVNMPPYSYVRSAARAPGLRVFATHVAEGSPTYAAYVVALEDGRISQLTDVTGRRFGYVDPSSTSGFLFPAHRMLQEGIHPLNDLEPVFLGSHDRVFDAVVSGEVEAGAVFAAALLEGRRRNEDGARVRVISKARRIPCDAYVARPGLPDAVSAAFAVALSEISTRSPEGRELLRSGLQINGFLPVDDHHYDVVREVDAAVREAVPRLDELTR
jgi:phosphate/phosphite/phosphonate ABC transporter binding protein